MSAVITDHTHVWTMRGRWRTHYCETCGNSVGRHLSYGQDIASRLGGDPYDYIDGDRDQGD